jgi:PhnB protein
MSITIPEGQHSVTPRLVVGDPAGLVQFLKATFGASGDFETDAPSEVRIGDSIVMVSGVGPREARPGFLYVYVDDADETYERALEAGATSVETPAEMPWGDRRAMVTDPFGNDWQIATHKPSPTR